MKSPYKVNDDIGMSWADIEAHGRFLRAIGLRRGGHAPEPAVPHLRITHVHVLECDETLTSTATA